jgi:hypothetical protein
LITTKNLNFYIFKALLRVILFLFITYYNKSLTLSLSYPSTPVWFYVGILLIHDHEFALNPQWTSLNFKFIDLNLRFHHLSTNSQVDASNLTLSKTKFVPFNSNFALLMPVSTLKSSLIFINNHYTHFASQNFIIFNDSNVQLISKLYPFSEKFTF